MTNVEIDCSLFLSTFALTAEVSFTCKELGSTHLAVSIMYYCPLSSVPKAKIMFKFLLVIVVMSVI
jgi:hypothetical protein